MTLDITTGATTGAPTTGPSLSPTKSLAELKAACFQAVVDEFNPTGFAETMLARELAHCAAQIIRDEQRLEAAKSQAEDALIRVVTPLDDGVSASLPLSISQICAPERLETLSRVTLRNSNAFALQLRRLTDLQRDRNSSHAGLQERDPRFATEAHCVAYLARRFRSGHQLCRNCGRASGGCWIATRRCWECKSCRAQTCIRQGTVMARSHITLVIWFHGIRIVLYHPSISAAKLAAAIGIRRVSTARSMLAKIRAALVSDKASGQLAGLDTIYLPGPESSALFDMHSDAVDTRHVLLAQTT